MKGLIKCFGPTRRLFFYSKLFRVRHAGGKIGKEIFTRIWYSNWLKEGYATPEDRIIEKYQKLDPWSVDNILFFLGVLPIGTIRFIITPNEGDLPVIRDFEVRRIWEDKKIMEITLLTLTERFRGFHHIPSMVLMKKAYQYAKAKEIEGIVIAADERTFHLLIKTLMFPFHQIGKEKMYEGSLTYPAYLDFAEAEDLVRKINPDLYRFFTT